MPVPLHLQSSAGSAPLLYQGFQGNALQTSPQLLVFYVVTGQTPGCFASAGMELFVVNHCEEVAKSLKTSA